MRSLIFVITCILPLVFAAGAAGGAPFCPDPAAVDGTPSPAPCLPGYPGHEVHDADDDTTAAGESEETHDGSDWLVNEHRGESYTVAFDTDEGTWMNVDLSPDGTTLVLDLLGDLYTLPAAGGEATRITSGPAYDMQPRFSPDGAGILFTSDRGGSDNVWTMALDGTGLRPVTTEGDKVMNSGDWSPDGEYIVARKRLTDRSSLGTTELWLYHRLGGKGVQLTKKDEIPDAGAPVFSPDGRWIYFEYRNSRYRYNRNVYAGIYQIRAYDRETGRIRVVTDGYGGSGRPRLSPDGSTLAFVRRDRDETLLMLHDLETGGERVLFRGLDQDMQENFNWTGIYPGYDWTADGEALVVWYGGGLHRIAVADGRSAPIPFTARVEQEVAERAIWPRDIAPDEFRVRMISWPQITPDGGALVFGALGRVYRMALPDGEPRVLDTEGARAYGPRLSPDGRRLAYVSWSDDEGGHVWTMPAAGGGSRRVTDVTGQYANPAFSRDGKKLAYVKGVGAPRRGHPLGREHHLEIHWATAGGGTREYVVTVDNRGASRPMPRPFWSADGGRILYFEDVDDGKTALTSIRPDGTERRELVRVKYAEEIVPSPDGRWIAYSKLFEGYLAALPEAGRQTLELSGSGDPVPSHRFARDGVTWLAWSGDGTSLTWGFGPDVYRLSLDDVRREWSEAREAQGKKTVPSPDDDEADGDDPGDDDDHHHRAAVEPEPDPAEDAADDAGDEEEEEKTFTAAPDTISIHLTVPRHRPEGVLALTGARIITMAGDGVIENGTLVIRDDRIEAVGPAPSVEVPDGARVVNVAGKTVIPGIVDAHAHMHYRHLDIIPETMSSYYANLAYGVTTTHDPSASTYAVFTQSEMVEAGITAGPRTFSTGFILYGADIPNKAPTGSLDDARRHVRRLKKLGAISVKSYMQPRREQRQWIMHAAREESVMVMPEGGGNLEANLGMVLDGHTGIEHSLPVAPLYRDVVELFARTKTGYTPTLLVAYGGLSGEHWFYQHSEVWQDEKLLRFLARGPVDARSRRRPVMASDDDWHHMDVAAGCKAVVEAGGRVQLGAHGQLQGLGVHWELWALTQGGMTNHDALRCATLFGAEYLGMDGLIGSLEPGKLADLVVLDADPLEDIENSNTVRYVVKNGEMFDGDTMDRVWPEPAPRPRFHWQTEE